MSETSQRDQPAMKDAADWHSHIAERFDDRYNHSAGFKERLDVWRALIAQFAKPAGYALDAGCGSGVLSVIAASYCSSVTAFDASPQMVQLAREKAATLSVSHKLAFSELRMEHLAQLPAEHFDLVISSSVLEYLEGFWPAFDQLVQRLAPGGTLLFSIPNMSSLYRQTERAVYAVTGRPRYMGFVRAQPRDRDIEAGLAARNLRIVAKQYYAPAPLASRLARPAGLRKFADNLVVYACQRG